MPAPHIKTKEIKKLRQQGYSHSEISNKLNVSKSTVSNIVKNIKITDKQKIEIKKRGIKKRSISSCKETDTHKYCPKCNKTKIHDEFYKRGQYLMGYCKPCQKSYSNKRKTHQRKELQQIIKNAKNIPCADCKEKHPSWAMDFDHIHPKTKKYNVGAMVSQNISTETLIKEIKKCEVVCALCHRYRTYGNGINRDV